MSRLPAKREESWRVGHLRRVCPEGYRETIYDEENVIEDEDLRLFYDKIRIITQGDIWSAERMKTILDMTTGKYDILVSNYVKRHPETVGK